MSPNIKSKSGRPRKFEGPSKVITLTLPTETLQQIESICHDRAKAIVQAVRAFAEIGRAHV